MEKLLSLMGKDPCNRDILLRYYKVRTSQVRLATLVFEFTRLVMMSHMFGKRFEDATVEDLEDLVYKVNQRHKNLNTQNKCRKILKAFYRWLKGFPKGEYPPEVRWIQLNKIPLITVTTDDLLPYEECVRITECATNLRDKALFQCKLDAGCRIGEILTVKVGEVKFNDAGAILYSDGKTGYQPLILTWSSKTLALWLNQHPFRNDKEAPLWITFDRSKPEQLSYSAARTAFANCVRKAGYKRRVWLHLLKHVSSTEDAVKGMPDSLRRFKHHWTQNSKMPAVYEHLSESIIPSIQAETWKRLGGMPFERKPHKQEEQPLELIKTCGRCEYENPRDSLFCNRCAFPLDQRKAVETMVPPEINSKKQELDGKINKLTAELAKTPEVVDKLLEALTLLKNEDAKLTGNEPPKMT